MVSGLCKLAESCAAGEAVYYPGSTFFIDPESMTPLQLLWTFTSYGYVLFVSANMIGDGAELLLLIPKYKDLVASVVLPILGAVPDGMMVLFSGVGPLAVAQENVAVGVGALAGSTIMLLTLPWILSFYGGKVDIVDGQLQYDKKKTQRDTNSGAAMIFRSGVGFEAGAKDNAKIMMVTSMAYMCIQIPALFVDDQKTQDEYPDTKAYIQEVKIESGAVHTASLVGAVVTVLLMAAYLYLQIKAANAAKSAAAAEDAEQGQVPLEGMPYQGVLGLKAAPTKVMKDGWLEEKGMRMHIQYLRDRVKEEHKDKENVELAYAAALQTVLIQKRNPISGEMKQELISIYKKYAKKTTSVDGIALKDMQEALAQIGLNYSEGKFATMFKDADVNKSNDLQLDEFLEFFSKYVIYSTESLPWEEEGEDDDDDEMPDEFKTLPPDQQQKKILQSSVQQMLFGTVLVLIFSDPMVDVLSQIGKMTGVPPFYVSFVLAPLASNASELVASLKLAQKKSAESITQSLQTLEGAAIMNNTFCLGIFYVLIYMQGLAWKFTAETISIVFVQILVGAMVLFKSQQTMLYGIIVFSFYPLSLALVAFLEAHGID